MASRYVLVAGPALPGGELPPGQRTVTVSAPPELARLASSMAASAGLRSKAVPVGSRADFALVVDGSSPDVRGPVDSRGLRSNAVPVGSRADFALVGSPDRSGPEDSRGPVNSSQPASVRYDARVLGALVPGAQILVGSLRVLMPGTSWLTDPGGMVVSVPGPPAARGPAAGPERRLPSVRGPAGPITVHVGALPKPPLGVHGPVMRVALDEPRVRGVPLSDGDVVVDRGGSRWFARGGVLWSHKSATLRRDDVLIEGRSLRPARAGSALGAGVAGRLTAGDKLEILLVGERTDTLYGTLTTVDPVTWVVTLDVDRAIVSDPRATCFGARLAATAAECYAAGGVWDRPCAVDTECPHFDARTGRGGCSEGTCEMPLGVGNLSFRVADPGTPPLCRGDGASPYCADGEADAEGGIIFR